MTSIFKRVDAPGRCCQKCPFDKKDPKPEVIGCKFFQPLELIPDPGAQDYYWYEGSRTTPPCTENVLWVVMSHSMKMTYDQWKKFSFKGNFRQTQSAKAIDVHFLNGKPPAEKPKNEHSFVEDCGPWHLNCAKHEYYA